MEIERFERKHIDCVGCYVGRDLTGFGFPYAPGEYIPAADRPYALSEYLWAIAARRLSRNLSGLAVA